MKIHLELEIEPEELRRLVGLPDMQPIWDSVQKRITDGDTEMVQQIAKTAFTEGMKTLDVTTRLLKTVSGLATKRDADGKASSKAKTTTRKTTTKRRATSATPSNKAGE